MARIDYVLSIGTPRRRGLTVGQHLGRQIEWNVAAFMRSIEVKGLSWQKTLDLSNEQKHLLAPETLQEIEGMATSSRVPLNALLAYNLNSDQLGNDGCTVMMALGSATPYDGTIFFKNSDKVGGDTLIGENFYKNKEINVLVDVRPESGNRIVGVAAAGQTGLKMGLNSKGVAAGSNIARTTELASKTVSLTQERAPDRAQLLRDGLEENSAKDATKRIIGQIVDTPTATPGNVEFADPKSAYVIEGSYDHFSIDRISDGVLARTNCFVLLDKLNDPKDISSQKRYARCLDLLGRAKPNVTAAKMIEFSMDHENGPGPNSICRHGTQFKEETTLSSAVMELNHRDPRQSTINVTLGKPCSSWLSNEAHTLISMATSEVPRNFLNGDVWKKHYTEEAALVR